MARRNTAGKSQLLEHAVETLHALGFQVYDSKTQFEKAQIVPPRYVIRNYPCMSIYGTPGKKEAFIVAMPTAAGDFVPSPDGLVRVLVEAKWQQASGSVDEKMPFVWQSFLESDIPNWIVLMGGANWKTRRGQAVVDWMKRQQAPEGRRWHVLEEVRGFARFATTAWKES